MPINAVADTPKEQLMVEKMLLESDRAILSQLSDSTKKVKQRIYGRIMRINSLQEIISAETLDK